MPPQSDLFQSALKALEQKRYLEAIDLLEMFEKMSSNLQAKQYLKIRMGLIEAYFQSGQKEKAMQLCQQLATHKNPEVQAWVQNQLELFLEVQQTQQEETVTESISEQTAEESTETKIKLKSLPEFKRYCEKHLISELKKFEKKRKEALRAVTVSAILGVIIVAVTLRGAWAVILVIQYTLSPHVTRFSNPLELSVSSWFFCLLFILLILSIWVAFYSSCTEAYSQGFKSKIIKKVIDFIDENRQLTYTQVSLTEQIIQTKFDLENSYLFSESINIEHVNQSDSVYGKIGKTNIIFSDVYAMSEFCHFWLDEFIWDSAVELVISLIIRIVKGFIYVFSRVGRGRRINYKNFKEEVIINQVSRILLFKGLFFKANFNKNFSYKTVIIPNHLEAKIQYSISQKGELIKLEDPEFNRFFTVYGDDQIESRYILSTNLISRLVEFTKKAKRKVYISFIDSTIYIAIRYDHDLFEPKLFKSMMTFAPMREYFENLQLMLGIVEDLSLNRRIWGTK